MAKTRSLASEWISKGKIRLNDNLVKSSKEVKYGDVITVQKNTASFKFEIIGIIDRRIGAPLVKDFLRDITSQEEVDKFKEYLSNQKTFHSFGDSKGSKKDRRELDDFLGNWD
jgi:ribosome-associated heat shock protein Hsp15